MIYNCFFFYMGRIIYWENIECESNDAIEDVLRSKLSRGEWDAGEAWIMDKLVCRIQKPARVHDSSHDATQQIDGQ